MHHSIANKLLFKENKTQSYGGDIFTLLLGYCQTESKYHHHNFVLFSLNNSSFNIQSKSFSMFSHIFLLVRENKKTSNSLLFLDFSVPRGQLCHKEKEFKSILTHIFRRLPIRLVRSPFLRQLVFGVATT